MGKVWVCNECGSHEYNAEMVSRDDLDFCGCAECGANEFHIEEKLTQRIPNKPRIRQNIAAETKRHARPIRK